MPKLDHDEALLPRLLGEPSLGPDGPELVLRQQHVVAFDAQEQPPIPAPFAVPRYQDGRTFRDKLDPMVVLLKIADPFPDKTLQRQTPVHRPRFASPVLIDYRELRAVRAKP